MVIVKKLLFMIGYMAILYSLKVNGIPLKDIVKNSIGENSINLIKKNNENISDTESSGALNKNVGLYGGGESQVQADGTGLKDPTARIIVTVMKRSRRFWEPWELNYSRNEFFIFNFTGIYLF